MKTSTTTRMRLLAMTAAGAIGLASAMPASAATAVFDFGANNALDTIANPDIYTLTVNALTVTVRAYSGIYNTVDFSNPVDATWTNGGLGVAGNGSGQINHTGGALRLAPGEGLLLDFSQAVTLDRLVFSDFDLLDDVDMAWGSGIANGAPLYDVVGVFGGVWNPIFNYTGTQFFIAAKDDGVLDTAEGFRLSSIRVNYQPVAAAVPEPATWAMMLLGFGVIGGAMRRRQRQSVRFHFA